SSMPENQTTRIEHIRTDVRLAYGDVTDGAFVLALMVKEQPNEIYNLAAQSHVGISFHNPEYTAQATGIGALNVYEGMRLGCPTARLYQASSSEMFGNSIDDDGFQREDTPMRPVSPYGCAKLFAHNLLVNYRHSYGLHMSSGILFNHESPRRGTNFVTAKVVKEAIRVKRGLTDAVYLGNLEARRDWGHAKDYVWAMWKMLQQPEADDYVVATGVTHSVRELVETVFERLGLDMDKHCRKDERYYRAEELDFLHGDSTKARTVLGWSPKYDFDALIDDMIAHWEVKL
ncbi:MAG: GDP-mannose 4,6-dehydratase, partial [Planctomycetota bacterium]